MKKISVLLGVILTVVAVAPIAAQLSPRATRPQVVPPQGPVRQVIFKNCTSCHGIDDYAYNALDSRRLGHAADDEASRHERVRASRGSRPAP
jgi:cytochrome c553